MENVELSFTPKKSKYIQSLVNKANIAWEYENHPKDPMAIAIYTLKRDKSKVFLGYLKKRNAEKNYTYEAETLYYRAKNNEINWKEAQKSEYWNEGEVEFTNIYTDEELQQVLKDIENKKYKFTFNIYGNSFLNRAVNLEQNVLLNKKLSCPEGFKIA